MLNLPFPAPDLLRDANAPSGANEFGDLPEWDLSYLYTGDDAP